MSTLTTNFKQQTFVLVWNADVSHQKALTPSTPPPLCRRACSVLRNESSGSVSVWAAAPHRTTSHQRQTQNNGGGFTVECVVPLRTSSTHLMAAASSLLHLFVLLVWSLQRVLPAGLLRANASRLLLIGDCYFLPVCLKEESLLRVFGLLNYSFSTVLLSLPNLRHGNTVRSYPWIKRKRRRLCKD